MIFPILSYKLCMRAHEIIDLSSTNLKSVTQSQKCPFYLILKLSTTP
jgi:hypothetical protein